VEFVAAVQKSSGHERHEKHEISGPPGYLKRSVEYVEFVVEGQKSVGHEFRELREG
jgi:hypothetical protein